MPMTLAFAERLWDLVGSLGVFVSAPLYALV